ncbi:hypothetical protein FRC07_013555, partial [Ceratobasidium sp. 392]
MAVLAAIICASPELELLDLRFGFCGFDDEGRIGEEPNMEGLFLQLLNDNFPRLRVFEAIWEFISPTLPGLQRFLVNHPELNAVAFGK